MGSCTSKTSAATETPQKRISKKPSAVNNNNSITDIDKTLLDLKNARDRLHRYRDKLNRDDDRLVQKALQAKRTGRHTQALGIMRLRKYKQTQVATCEDQLLNVLQMVETIDSKQNEAQVLQALTAGKDTLQQLHQETTVEDVLDLMDSIKQEAASEHEMNELLQGVPTLSAEDEAAVAAELEEMMMMNQETPSSSSAQKAPTPLQQVTTKLPSAPSTALPHQQEPAQSASRAAPRPILAS